jgi:SAM-dependent methyltransferase
MTAEAPPFPRQESPVAKPPALLRRFFRQFGRPEGRLGALAGYVMAARNVQVNRWAVEAADLHPASRVLDLGCGPGVAVSLAARRVSAGTVLGIDPSDVMVRQARARNARLLAEGRVDIQRAGADRLPLPDGAIDRIIAVNSLFHWPSLGDGLREARRVLAPRGRLVVAVRLRDRDARRYDRAAYGFPPENVAELTGAFVAAGFTVADCRRRTVDGEATLFIVAEPA